MIRGPVYTRHLSRVAAQALTRRNFALYMRKARRRAAWRVKHDVRQRRIPAVVGQIRWRRNSRDPSYRPPVLRDGSRCYDCNRPAHTMLEVAGRQRPFCYTDAYTRAAEME